MVAAPYPAKIAFVYPDDISLCWFKLFQYEISPMEELMEKTTLFKSNRSQAVRLPKAVAMPEDVKQVDIIAVGRTRIITPAGESWDSWFDGESASPDFMASREQPGEQDREAF